MTTVTLNALVEGSGAAVTALAASVQPALGEGLARNAMPHLESAIAAALESALDIDLVGLLAGAWKQALALKPYRDPAKAPAGSPAHLPLADHVLAIEVDPELRIELAGMPVAMLPVRIDLSCAISGALLVIEEAAITAVKLGTLAPTAALRWGEGKFAVPLPVKTLTLPGRLALSPPLRLGEAPASAAA